MIGSAQGERRLLFLDTLRSTACLAIVSILIVASAMFCIFYLRSEIAARRSSVDARMATLTLNRRLLVAAPSKDTLDRRDPAGFWIGKNEAAVAADFQNSVRSVVVGQNAQLRMLSPLPVRASNKLKFVGLSIEYTSSLQLTKEIIQSLERMRPYVFLDRVGIRLEPPPGFSSNEPQALIELQVSGAVWSRAGSNTVASE